MAGHIGFDVDICDSGRRREFRVRVKPALESAGARCLGRGPARAVLVEGV